MKSALVRFSDPRGTLKAKAKGAAKSAGVWFYDWLADAIREKVYRQGLVERYVVNEDGVVFDTKTGDRLETPEEVHEAMSATLEGR